MNNKYIDIATFSQNLSITGSLSFILETIGKTPIVCIIDTKTGNYYRLKLRDLGEAMQAIYNTHSEMVKTEI